MDGGGAVDSRKHVVHQIHPLSVKEVVANGDKAADFFCERGLNGGRNVC